MTFEPVEGIEEVDTPRLIKLLELNSRLQDMLARKNQKIDELREIVKSKGKVDEKSLREGIERELMQAFQVTEQIVAEELREVREELEVTSGKLREQTNVSEMAFNLARRAMWGIEERVDTDKLSKEEREIFYAVSASGDISIEELSGSMGVTSEKVIGTLMNIHRKTVDITRKK